RAFDLWVISFVRYGRSDHLYGDVVARDSDSSSCLLAPAGPKIGQRSGARRAWCLSYSKGNAAALGVFPSLFHCGTGCPFKLPPDRQPTTTPLFAADLRSLGEHSYSIYLRTLRHRPRVC